MAEDEDSPDFLSFWKRVLPKPAKAEVPKTKGWNVLRAIERAARNANEELSKCPPYDLGENASRVATKAVECFLEHWYEELRQGDAVSLVGIVLDGANLEPEELKAFVRALPITLLDRICKEPGPQASGVQALLAIEVAFRKALIMDYRLIRDMSDNKLTVVFSTLHNTNIGPPQEHLVTFKLDETFEGIRNAAETIAPMP